MALLLDVLVDPAKTQVPIGGYASLATSTTAWEDLKVGVLDPEPWLYEDSLVQYAEGSKEQIVRASLPKRTRDNA